MFLRAAPCTEIERGQESYPASLQRFLGSHAPAALMTFGNVELLQLSPLAFFASIRTPPDLILRSYDLARQLRQAGVGVAGGFQSPLERECLTLLLRGSQPIVAAAARGIEGMRIPRPWRQGLGEGRLLIISPFARRRRRPTVRSAAVRNRVVTAVAERVFVVHARPGSRTFETVVTALGWGKDVYCFDHARNRDLVLIGAQPVAGSELIGRLRVGARTQLRTAAPEPAAQPRLITEPIADS